MANPTKKVIPYEEYKQLALLFLEASAHLGYCGFGDEWERECAKEDKLPQRLEKMATRIEQILKLNGE